MDESGFMSYNEKINQQMLLPSWNAIKCSQNQPELLLNWTTIAAFGLSPAQTPLE